MPVSKKTRYIPVLIAALALQLCTGLIYTWSVFQPYVVSHFGWASADAARTSSFMLLAFVSGSLLGGILQDKTNPRLVVTLGSLAFCGGIFLSSLLGGSRPWMIYLTFSTLSGLGVGFVYASVLSCVQKWMPHRKGLASGLSVGAFGLSVVVFSPVAEAILSRYGVPITFRVLAVFFLIITAFACLFFKNPPDGYMLEDGRKPEKARGKSLTPQQTLRSPLFYCMFFSSFFIVGSYTLFLPLIKTLAVARGMSSELSVVTVMITGVMMVAAKLLSPIVSEKIGRARTIVVLAVINAVGALLMTVASGTLYIAAACLIVSGYGGPSGVWPVLITDTFGDRYSGTNLGLLLMSIGLSSVVFSKISSLLNAGGASSGDGTASFLVAGFLSIIPVVLMTVFGRLRAKRHDAVPLHPAVLQETFTVDGTPSSHGGIEKAG